MIPNIRKGRDFHQLLAYLVGPGRHEEHSHPHLVAGDVTVVAWHPKGAELGREEASKIADELRIPTLSYKGPGKTVWHCSLSLRRGEEPLSDERWEQIVGEFMTAMEFIGHDGEAGFVWAAVRHGLATDGRDHVHIVAATVHEDPLAPRWRDAHDFWRAQQACRALEERHGLHEVGSVRSGSKRWSKPAEIVRARREGKSETDRDQLRRIVRACADSSSSEAEFIARLRSERLSLSLRRDPHREDAVIGYSVALPAGGGEQRIRYGGGKLARDLTLPRLRQRWAEPTAVASAWR